MFESLSDRFDGIFKKLRSRGKLTDKDIDEVARELRVALLEADVNVASPATSSPGSRSVREGAEVAKSLSPAQQVIKIVNEELVATLGGTTGKLTMSSKPPTVVMMAGLQGCGQDDRRRQAGPPAQAAGPAPAAGRCRPPASRRGGAAARARRARRRAGVLGADTDPVAVGARRASRKRRGSVATS